MTDPEKGFDRQLGEAKTRVDEHDRRLTTLEEATNDIRKDIRNLEKNVAEINTRISALDNISSSVNELVKKSSELDGFMKGFKAASNIWYAVMTLIGGVVGFAIKEILSKTTT